MQTYTNRAAAKAAAYHAEVNDGALRKIVVSVGGRRPTFTVARAEVRVGEAIR